MNRDIFIKNLTGDRIEMSPKGRCANELSVEEFEKKKNAHWAFIFVSHKEYSYYLNNFGKQFQRGK